MKAMKTILAIVLILNCTVVLAQDLKTSLSEVLRTNPSVLEKLKAYNAVKEDIAIARSGYYPKLDLSVGIGYEKGEREIRVPNDYDYNVYETSLKLTQNIFAGFQTTHLIDEQKYRTMSAAYGYVEKVNEITIKLAEAYLEVLKNKDLLDTAKENVKLNEEIFNRVQKLYKAGLTRLSEVNKIESALSLAKSTYVVQKNNMLNAEYKYHKLFGRYIEVNKMVKPELNVKLPKNMQDAIQYATTNNLSLIVYKYGVKTAQSVYNGKKSPFYPQVDIEISQQLNNNLSGTEGYDDKFRAMAYVRYNFFNGFADYSALQKSASKIHEAVYAKNNKKREIVESLSISWVTSEKLQEKLKYLEMYYKFSSKSLALYAKEYDLGRRSLLDLLAAQNDFIGSKKQIIETEYGLLYAKYKILDAMGILVPTILGNTDEIYLNVGLIGDEPKNNDKLPINYDSDRDLITDDMDICDNSIQNEMRNEYGCKELYYDTRLIERYSEFTFSDGKSQILTDEGEDRLSRLIDQIMPYGFEYLKFDIFGNVDNENMLEEEKIELSKKRAEYIKTRLIEVGAKKENISVYANSDKAPLYSDEDSQGTERNNRVDIVVKKLKKK